MADKFPEFIAKKEEFLYTGVKSFYEYNDVDVKAHRDLVKATQNHSAVQE